MSICSGLYTSHHEQRPGVGLAQMGPLMLLSQQRCLSSSVPASRDGVEERVWTTEKAFWTVSTPSAGRWASQQQLGWLDLNLEAPLSHYGHIGSLLAPGGVTFPTITSPPASVHQTLLGLDLPTSPQPHFPPCSSSLTPLQTHQLLDTPGTFQIHAHRRAFALAVKAFCTDIPGLHSLTLPCDQVSSPWKSLP